MVVLGSPGSAETGTQRFKAATALQRRDDIKAAIEKTGLAGIAPMQAVIGKVKDAKTLQAALVMLHKPAGFEAGLGQPAQGGAAHGHTARLNTQASRRAKAAGWVSAKVRAAAWSDEPCPAIM